MQLMRQEGHCHDNGVCVQYDDEGYVNIDGNEHDNHINIYDEDEVCDISYGRHGGARDGCEKNQKVGNTSYGHHASYDVFVENYEFS